MIKPVIRTKEINEFLNLPGIHSEGENRANKHYFKILNQRYRDATDENKKINLFSKQADPDRRIKRFLLFISEYIKN